MRSSAPAARGDAPGKDVFGCAQWTTQATGAPALVDALVTFDCHVREHFRFGSHLIFIAEAADIRFRQSGRALIYANRAYGTPLSLDRFLGETGAPAANGDALRIGCFVTLGPFFIPRLIASFLETHPEASSALHEGVQEQLGAGLEAGAFDVALMYDVAPGEDLEKGLLAEVAPHVLLPAEHPLARARSVSLGRLAGEPMVLLDISPGRDYFTSLFTEVGLAPRVAFRSPSFETVRGMVGNGLGYTLLVSKPANSMTYDGKAVVTRPIAERVSPGRIVIAHARARPPREPST